MHQRTPQLVRFPQRLLWPFLILNGVITGFMVTIIIIFHVQTESREGNPLYESTILVIVIINGLIAISASIVSCREGKIWGDGNTDRFTHSTAVHCQNNCKQVEHKNEFSQQQLYSLSHS
eukprot:TRINITY_DN1545_c1_g1_i6.p1 TRINITY_DN1545_c1_g1~~TRINITY_DN1545_c1_g1_i6.p1  ORF type:complete len:120 (-),score=7.58 TRINITY_DN1545_c1_g1_i6:304-663(-)